MLVFTYHCYTVPASTQLWSVSWWQKVEAYKEEIALLASFKICVYVLDMSLVVNLQ